MFKQHDLDIFERMVSNSNFLDHFKQHVFQSILCSRGLLRAVVYNAPKTLAKPMLSMCDSKFSISLNRCRI